MPRINQVSEPQKSVSSDTTPADEDSAKKEIAESIVAIMPIALLVLETDLRVRIASQTFYETFQVTPEMTEGQLVYDLGNGQWNIPKLRTLLEEILPDNEIFIGYEVAHTFEGIGHRTMLLNGRRLDNVQLILLIIVDITERKAIEDALQVSHNRLEMTLTELEDTQRHLVQQERLAAVGGLAAGIAHDFNNILSIIVLNVELSLHAQQVHPKLYGQLVTIAQQMKRATKMVQQILDFGRRGVPALRPLDLVPVLKEQVELLQLTLSANVTLNLNYGNDEYIVDADSTHMQQILINLALNALDALPEGGELGMGLGRLQLMSQDEAPLPGMAPGEWIQVSVSDNGSGIPSDVLPHLFEPFFTTKAPGKGTGLGLAQVYGLVQQHQGHIAVQSQEGEGTTFIIYLPAHVEHSPPVVITGIA
jgi:signal transduction histidine kinase